MLALLPPHVSYRLPLHDWHRPGTCHRGGLPSHLDRVITPGRPPVPSPPRLAFGSGLPDTQLVPPTVTQLTDRLIASYARSGGINHLDGKNLPSKQAIADITVDLLRLLFPGFFDEKLIHSSEIKVETAALIDTVLGSLEDEVYKSLEYRPPEEYSKKADLRHVSHTLTLGDRK